MYIKTAPRFELGIEPVTCPDTTFLGFKRLLQKQLIVGDDLTITITVKN